MPRPGTFRPRGAASPARPTAWRSSRPGPFPARDSPPAPGGAGRAACAPSERISMISRATTGGSARACSGASSCLSSSSFIAPSLPRDLIERAVGVAGHLALQLVVPLDALQRVLERIELEHVERALGAL